MKKIFSQLVILMAVVQNPVTGRTRGKFASAIFSKQFGKNTMRSKPIEVKNPKSIGQLTQRAMFNVVLAFAQIVLLTVRVGWKNAASGMSAYNAFFKHAILNAVSGSYPDFAIDFSKIVVASGSLLGFLSPLWSSPAGHKIMFAWSDNSDQGNASAEDILFVCLINTTNGNTLQISTDKTRVDEEYTSPEFGETNDKCQCYAFFVDAVTGNVSDSIYSGEITLVA